MEFRLRTPVEMSRASTKASKAIASRVVLLWSLLAFFSPEAFAQALVPAWVAHPPDTAPDTGQTLAARVLADGTLLVVVHLGGQWGEQARAVHVAAGGALLGSVAFPSPTNACAAIASDGAVYLSGLDRYGPTGSFVDVTKWDGLTGAPLWPSPPSLYAHGMMVSLTVDEQGDLVFELGEWGFEANSLEIGRIDGRSGAVLARESLDESTDLLGLTVAGGTASGLTLNGWSGNLAIFDLGAPGSARFLVPDGLGTTSAASDRRGGFGFGGTGRGSRCFAAAVDSAGVVRWTRSLSELGGACSITSTAVDGEGALLVAGSAGGQAFVERLALSDGSVLSGPWRTSLAGSSTAADPLLSSGGDLHLTFETTASDGTVETGLVSLDGRSLATRWGPVPLPPKAGRRTALLLGASGEILYVGSGDSSAGPVPPTVLRYRTADGSAIGGPIALELTHGGGVVRGLACDASANVTALVAEPSGQAAVARLDGATGALLWRRDVEKTGSSWFYGALAVAPGGEVLFCGSTGAVLKLNASGGTAWGPLMLPPRADTRIPIATGVDSSGDFYVLGEGPTLTKLAGADGTRLYGPLVALAGGVLHVESTTVTGWAAGALVRWDAATGSVLWSHDTGGAFFDQIAVGPSQEVVLVEEYFSNNSYVTRLDAAGVSTWRVLVEPRISRVFIDPAGDVHVVGLRSWTPVCTKLSGTDGTTLWKRADARFDLAGFDGPDAALDGAGRLVVVGTSVHSTPDTNIVVLGYRTDTGADAFPPASWGSPAARGTAVIASGGRVLVGGSRVDADGAVVVSFGSALGFAGTTPAPAFCGVAYAQGLGARNGVPPVTHAVVGGSLPPGLSLDSATGVLTGVPAAPGVFPFRLRATDASTASVEADEVIVVAGGEDLRVIASSTDPCGALTLSLRESFSSYLWLPGGETTPAIVVDPSVPATVEVLAADGPCVRRGTYTVTVPRPGGLEISAPAFVRAGEAGTASVPARAGRTYAWEVTGGAITSGQGSAGIEFVAGPSGAVGLSVTESTPAGCALSASALVRLIGATTLFTPIRPCRVLDTRRYGDAPALLPGETRKLTIGLPTTYSDCGVPIDAQSVAVNVTVVEPETDGHLTLYPHGQERPDTSNVNAPAGRTRASFSILPLGVGGAVDVHSGFAGNVHVLVDVTGYFR